MVLVADSSINISCMMCCRGVSSKIFWCTSDCTPVEGTDWGTKMGRGSAAEHNKTTRVRNEPLDCSTFLPITPVRVLNTGMKLTAQQ